MKLRVAERALARNLRAKGLSYREIREQIGNIPKGTLNYWLRDIALTDEQKRRLLEKARTAGELGRQRGALANRLWREERLRRAEVFALQTFEIQLTDPLFAAGVILYACEGARTSNQFSFINSDPKLVNMMVRWLTEVCCVPVERIHARVYTHRMYEEQECESYWQRITGLPMSRFGKTTYKQTPHTVKKNPAFVGSCRLDVHKTDLFFVIRAWQELLLGQLLSSSSHRKMGGEDLWEGILRISLSAPRRATEP